MTRRLLWMIPLLTLLPAQAALADTVTLTNGRVLTGTVVLVTDHQVSLRQANGELRVFFRDEVRSFERTLRGPTPPMPARLDRVTLSDGTTVLGRVVSESDLQVAIVDRTGRFQTFYRDQAPTVEVAAVVAPARGETTAPRRTTPASPPGESAARPNAAPPKPPRPTAAPPASATPPAMAARPSTRPASAAEPPAASPVPLSPTTAPPPPDVQPPVTAETAAAPAAAPVPAAAPAAAEAIADKPFLQHEITVMGAGGLGTARSNVTQSAALVPAALLVGGEADYRLLIGEWVGLYAGAGLLRSLSPVTGRVVKTGEDGKPLYLEDSTPDYQDQSAVTQLLSFPVGVVGRFMGLYAGGGGALMLGSDAGGTVTPRFQPQAVAGWRQQFDFGLNVGVEGRFGFLAGSMMGGTLSLGWLF